MARASTLGFMLICAILVFGFEVSDSAEFYVGDSGGWGFNVADWPKGKSFKEGDVLVFNYPAEVLNVIVVDAAGYNSCIPNQGSKVYSSGNDRITLVKGDNYFICGISGHCEAGVKIAVRATKSARSSE